MQAPVSEQKAANNFGAQEYRVTSPHLSFGADQTNKYTNNTTTNDFGRKSYDATRTAGGQAQDASFSQNDSRCEDLKVKLERYKREREELDKIRTKIQSKSQERSSKLDTSQYSINTGSRQPEHVVNKENNSSAMPGMPLSTASGKPAPALMVSGQGKDGHTTLHSDMY